MDSEFCPRSGLTTTSPGSRAALEFTDGDNRSGELKPELVVGEGMVMTLFCDIRIAADDASFSLPEAKIGVPSINGTIRAVKVAGHGAAMELLMTGEARDAAWAQTAGFVNTVVPRDQLMDAAQRMARSIAANDQTAILIMRYLGERALEDRFSDLVEQGLELRSSIETVDMVDRQAEFVGRSNKGSE